jgi:hypothetical protein
MEAEWELKTKEVRRQRESRADGAHGKHLMILDCLNQKAGFRRRLARVSCQLRRPARQAERCRADHVACAQVDYQVFCAMAP